MPIPGKECRLNIRSRKTACESFLSLLSTSPDESTGRKPGIYRFFFKLSEPGALYFCHDRLHQTNCAAADRKSTRLNSSHANISYAVFCLKKKNRQQDCPRRRPRNLPCADRGRHTVVGGADPAHLPRRAHPGYRPRPVG